MNCYLLLFRTSTFRMVVHAVYSTQYSRRNAGRLAQLYRIGDCLAGIRGFYYRIPDSQKNQPISMLYYTLSLCIRYEKHCIQAYLTPNGNRRKDLGSVLWRRFIQCDVFLWFPTITNDNFRITRKIWWVIIIIFICKCHKMT